MNISSGNTAEVFALATPVQYDLTDSFGRINDTAWSPSVGTILTANLTVVGSLTQLVNSTVLEISCYDRSHLNSSACTSVYLTVTVNRAASISSGATGSV